MRKKIINCLLLLTICCCIPFLTFNTKPTIADSYSVTGGREIIEFNETTKSLFDVHTPYNISPEFNSGNLVFNSLSEHEVILKNRVFSNVEINVVLGTINKGGKFDAGVIFGVNNFVTVGRFNGYALSLEYSGGESYMKLHKWENTNWAGVKTEVSGVVLERENHLRVVVKDGYVYAFLNYSNTPTITYQVGSVSGNIGFRSFYAPNYFTDFSITGNSITLDKNEFNSLLSQANQIDKSTITANSRILLEEAIQLSESNKNSGFQSDIDNCVIKLKYALSKIVKIHTYSELTDLIEQARLLTNNGVYTVNSWNSLQQVIIQCSLLNSGSNSEDISYWYEALKEKQEFLIKYSERN